VNDEFINARPSDELAPQAGTPDRRDPAVVVPEISVVIPAYNAVRFLDATLASVAAQTFRAIEIIIVDDGSDDGTPALIKDWARRDSRIVSVRMENGGVAKARNRGIAVARAEFVAFVDADDLWHPDKLRLQIEELRAAGPDCAAAYVLYRMIDIDGRVTANGPTFTCSGYIYTRHLRFHLIGNGSSLLVRRSAALAVGGFDPTYAAEGIGGCEDLDFEIRLAAQWKIAGVPLFLLGYRRYDGNMSSDRHRMVRAMARTIDRNLASGPKVPRVAHRGARIAVLEYSVHAYVMRRDLIRAAVLLAELLAINPRMAIRVVKRLYKFVAKRLAQNGRGGAAWHSPESAPMFESLTPQDGLDQPVPPYISGPLRAAERVDGALWRRLKHDAATAPASGVEAERALTSAPAEAGAERAWAAGGVSPRHG
jgi:glycosyltransferase involved in cell wall biosynthesis